MNKDFFSGTTETASMSEEQLLKALSAGYGTDSASFTGGRAMIPEDIEMTMVNAMREQREDCKMMNTIKKQPVKSTVHEYNRRTDVGNYEFLSAEEGGSSVDSDQSIERVTRQIKYLQDRRSVTDQMELVDSFENAFEAEKMAGTLNVLKASEYLCFHGDSEIVPTQFDGILKQIKTTKEPNIINLGGKSIQSYGEGVFNEPALAIFESGGDANKLFFPPVLAQDIQDLVRDRVRFGTDDRKATLVVDQYPTPYGSTVSFGATEGADKFYRVKGKISASGNASLRPDAPSSVTAAAAADSSSKFVVSDAGNYLYSVHGINKYGISVGKELAAAVAVAAGDKVTLIITPSTSGKESGYIICRSNKNGSAVMEMIRVKKADSATTTVIDINKDLPGTSSMLFITEKKLQTVINYYQLCPLRLRPLFESNKAEKPFFIQLFGAVDTKVPEWCAVVENIAYKGGLY